jgi:hypothetical protein
MEATCQFTCKFKIPVGECAFNEFWRKREKKEDFLQIRAWECRTRLLDSFDFTRKKSLGRTSFHFSDLDVRAA